MRDGRASIVQARATTLAPEHAERSVLLNVSIQPGIMEEIIPIHVLGALQAVMEAA